ncbi:hypothetical protein B0H10DRAFT_523771 [Mycena sp. CBHHK59/15]|nr:hypothetical protein B0H10DRAFT_523771 [Mycena sp. CBHHK59/15]
MRSGVCLYWMFALVGPPLTKCCVVLWTIERPSTISCTTTGNSEILSCRMLTGRRSSWLRTGLKFSAPPPPRCPAPRSRCYLAPTPYSAGSRSICVISCATCRALCPLASSVGSWRRIGS